MENITIYGTIDKLAESYAELEQMAKNNGFKFTPKGAKANWESIQLKEKKLFGPKLEVTFSAKRTAQNSEFQQHLQDMQRLVTEIDTSHEHSRNKLLDFAAQTICGIGITTNSLETFTPVVSVMVRKLQGFTFYQGSFYDPDLLTILDLEGNSELKEEAPQADQLERKQNSESDLKERGISVLAHLPLLPSAQDITLRSQEQVAQRAIALAIVAVKAETNDDAIVQQVIQTYQAHAFFTPLERKFLMQSLPSDKERAQFAWRYEGFWVLLWALGYVASLSFPEEVCPVPEAVSYLREADGFSSFMQKAKMRSSAEILDACDWIYRAHWSCVNARMKKAEPPAGLDASVVYERHYALNWLISYQNQDWDHVTTDT
jgi:hypothetical protein